MTNSVEPIRDGTFVQMGAHTLVFGTQIVALRDSSAEAGDPATLRERLEEDGYLYMRGFHPRAAVLAARDEILGLLDEAGCLDPTQPRERGVIGGDEGARRVASDLGDDCPLVYDVQNKSKTVLFKLPRLQARVKRYHELIGSARFIDWFGALMGGAAEARLQNSIPRAVPTGEFTGAHYDVVYFGPRNDHIYTGWMPLSDIPLELGPLAVLLGSHRLERVRATYGQMDSARDRIEGWFSTNGLELVEQYGCRWASTNFTAGDVVLFGMRFMHGSLNNMTGRYRLSSDCRYQLIADRRPEDVPSTSSNSEPVKSMKQARAAWGV